MNDVQMAILPFAWPLQQPQFRDLGLPYAARLRGLKVIRWPLNDPCTLRISDLVMVGSDLAAIASSHLAGMASSYFAGTTSDIELYRDMREVVEEAQAENAGDTASPRRAEPVRVFPGQFLAS
ncbi:MAG: hypothetical protein ABSE46_10445 [Terracidiphilus sp.]